MRREVGSHAVTVTDYARDTRIMAVESRVIDLLKLSCAKN
jgi:hypothetical protein